MSTPPAEYSLAQRLADLERIAAEQEAVTPGGGWLARLFAERIAAEIEAGRPPPIESQIEGLLTSGLTGAALLRELWARFGQASRSEVFAGVAMAATVLVARAALAEIDAAVTVEREALAA